MLALIDGDVLVYRCGFAAEECTYLAEDGRVFNNPTSAKKAGYTGELEKLVHAEPVENALHNVKLAVSRIQHNTEADNVLICLSGECNFRDDIAFTRPYKGNRDPDHKPVHYDAIKDYLQSKWTHNISYQEEADDVMGWLQYDPKKPDDTIICTTDKDLDMILGFHYNINTEEVYFVDPWHADLFFYRQLLTGDPTDNVVGVPRIGEKTAAKLIKPNMSREAIRKTIEEKYLQAYEDDWEHKLREMGSLLWIRREPRQLWEPWTEWNEEERLGEVG